MDMRQAVISTPPLDEAIRLANGVDGDPIHRRVAVPAPPAGPERFVLPCWRHGLGVEFSNESRIAPWADQIEVRMIRQTWALAGQTWSVWVGQCPDCGTIYHAVLEYPTDL